MTEVTGLDQAEESAYRVLLRLPTASGPELAEHLGSSVAEATSLLLALEDAGMAHPVPDTPATYRATPPDLALGPLLHRREQELREIRTRISQLTDEYRSRSANEFVELVQGAQAIAQRLDQLQRFAHKEVRGLVKPPVVAVSAQDNEVEYELLAAGVRYRVVYDRELLLLQGDPYQVTRAAEQGEEARIAVDLPLKLAIADDDLALVPVADTQGEPSAIMVHPSGLLDALGALFETLWLSSTPILVGASGEMDLDALTDEPTPEDMRLLSLLLAGLTDQSMASQLGLSTRTVQRRLHDLIKITGVRTRVQLIWQATKRGWI